MISFTFRFLIMGTWQTLILIPLTYWRIIYLQWQLAFFSPQTICLINLWLQYDIRGWKTSPSTHSRSYISFFDRAHIAQSQLSAGSNPSIVLSKMIITLVYLFCNQLKILLNLFKMLVDSIRNQFSWIGFFVGIYRIQYLELQFTDRNFDSGQPIFRVYEIKVFCPFATLIKLVIKLKENEEKI